MPTTRPRHTITETEAVAQALDAAAERWPAERRSRSRLLLRLVEEGHRAVLGQGDGRLREREAAIERTSGALSDAYEPGYLDDLREDWPG